MSPPRAAMEASLRTPASRWRTPRRGAGPAQVTISCAPRTMQSARMGAGTRPDRIALLSGQRRHQTLVEFDGAVTVDNHTFGATSRARDEPNGPPRNPQHIG